ncbi:DciA family protein [Desulfovibrio piger]|uniref:DciA family protein n=1 Tax=Desulfovibrio piger TaxID=901 RepID=UPI0039F531D3
MPPASAGETASAVAPAEEQAPGRPPDAAARAAEADRLAAEYGLSSSGGGLVVLPGDEDGDDFPRDDGAPDARAAARSVMTAPAAPGSGPVCPLPDGYDGAGKATPPAGAGMGRREAAFRQWAAAMQARFDAGLEAEEDRAARRQEALVVLPPPAGAGGRERRTVKKPQAATAEAPRPRAWVTRRRSTEPGHEARFGEWPGPARTGSVLEKVFISLGASPEQAKLSRLWRSWDAVLGPDLAPLARPLGHHDDKLLIGAEDAVLLQELYYMGPEIVRRANDFLQEDFFTAVKVSLMLDHQDLDAPSPVLERSAGRPQEELPAPSGASLGLMDPESAVARCYARFLGMELPDPRK